MKTGSKKRFLVTFTLLTSLSVFLIMSGVALHGLEYISLPKTIISVFLLYTLLALSTLVWLILRATTWYDRKLSSLHEIHSEEIAALRAHFEKEKK
jgi:hypothetical protein